jgi:uncharacterized damage-inducible protein DinB
MATRGEALAARFETVNEDIVAAVTGSTDEQWRQPCSSEGWSVGVVAHHIAEVQQTFAGMVAAFAAGETRSPSGSMDQVHESNARHAHDHAAVGRPETLEMLKESRDVIAPTLRGLDDAQLDRIAGVFGGNELSVQRFVEYVVNGHAAEHLASLRTTLAG